MSAPLEFEDFYRSGRDRVVRALAMTLGDQHLAAEAADEALARAFTRWDRIAVYDDPGGWVYRVGLNWATSVRRRHLRRQPPADADTVDPPAAPETELAAALADLPVAQRAVVVCRFYLGFSEAQTAHSLGIRPGTAKSRLSRALTALNIRLAHLDPSRQGAPDA